MLASLAIRFTGLCMLVVGLAMCAWLGFNLFIEEQPEFTNSTNGNTRSAGKALILFGFGAALGGVMLVTGMKKPKKPSQNADAPVLHVRPYQPGWVRCPACGWKFSLDDAGAWDGQCHLRCGQRLVIEQD